MPCPKMFETKNQIETYCFKGCKESKSNGWSFPPFEPTHLLSCMYIHAAVSQSAAASAASCQVLLAYQRCYRTPEQRRSLAAPPYIGKFGMEPINIEEEHASRPQNPSRLWPSRTKSLQSSPLPGIPLPGDFQSVMDWLRSSVYFVGKINSKMPSIF